MKNTDSLKEAMFYDKAANDSSVVCKLCFRNCIIPNSQYGFCKTRYNDEGKLLALSWGKIDAYALDPIEKKPLYHFKPGSKVFSFACGGCNLKCKFCQNCELSQYTYHFDHNPHQLPPKDLLSLAIKLHSQGFAYTYSEPTVFFEYIFDFINECKKGFATKDYFHTFISNGQFSADFLNLIKSEKLFQAYNIDLKFISESKYKKYTYGSLFPVLNSIENLNDVSHVEVTNLIIPDLNDSPKSIKLLCKTIAGINKDIPLHFSRFFPRYLLNDKNITPYETLKTAFEIARNEGLNYVYIGNINSDIYSDTYCPNCGELLIKRNGFDIKSYFTDNSGNCPSCGHKINIIF